MYQKPSNGHRAQPNPARVWLRRRRFVRPPPVDLRRNRLCANRRAAAIAVGLLVSTSAAEPATASGLNVERVRLDPDEDGLHGGLSLGVDFQAGNSSRFDLSSSAALGFRRKRHLAFLVGSSKYVTATRPNAGEELSKLLAPDSRIINRAQVHLRYNYEFRPWLVAEVFAQVERDQFLMLDGRVLFGLGPRFVPFDDGDFSLALGTDWMLEYEALDPAKIVGPLPADTLVHRWSSYLSLIYKRERVRMVSTTYFQPRFDLFTDLRLMTEGTVDVTLFDPVSLRLTLRVRWDSMPSTFCGKAIEIAGCPAADQIQLREVDVALENAINVRF
jgi:hypothetical protein